MVILNVLFIVMIYLLNLKIGDQLWWQEGYCFWTPKENNVKTCDHDYHYSCNKSGIDYDIKLPKLGYSFSSKSDF